MRLWGLSILLVCSIAVFAQDEAPVVGSEEYQNHITAADCTYLINPAEFVINKQAEWSWRSDATAKVSASVLPFTVGDASSSELVSPQSVPRKNFIDDLIFARMEADGVSSAPLASDLEFARRVFLDLTGRIPAVADLDAFVINQNPAKREMLIDSLMGSPEFVDKWTMFLGDLFKNNANATNINRAVEGRDMFYLYIKDAVASNKPYDVIARELIAGNGDTFANGAANWIVGTTVPMGPAQDTYDGGAVQTASTFLGINAVDCLLCHDGRRHLDQVNLWGSRQTRMNMWGLSAYFDRARMTRTTVTQTPLVQKFVVTDASAGAYTLNTTTGNRSARQPVGGVASVAPHYPFTNTPGTGIVGSETYRAAVARQVTSDFQFSRAAVNYVWEKLMVEAFVSPSNGFDPDRLDPSSALPEGWSLQPTNAQLLNQLAFYFQQSRYDLRSLISVIVKSNAYQLSSRYPADEWKAEYVPYYARHFVRRLDAEEIHDAIAKATNIIPTYPLQASAVELPDVHWAMQLPDTREPVRNGASAAFLNSFGRGDRDQNRRRSDGSVLQALNMMNNAYVMGRVHQNNAGSRVAAILNETSEPVAIIQQLFLNTLSRPATDAEVGMFQRLFQQQSVRVAAESLQWILLNKLEFLFNY